MDKQSTKRCVTGCKGLPEEICTKSPRCTYFKRARPYCRLSNQFKLYHPTCHITRRMTKKNKVDVAKERLKAFFYKKKRNSSITAQDGSLNRSVESVSPNAMDNSPRSRSPREIQSASAMRMLTPQQLHSPKSPNEKQSASAMRMLTPQSSPSSLSDELNDLMVRPTARSKTRTRASARRSRARSR